MELLNLLFPGLEEDSIGEIPNWDGFDYPWNILEDRGFGLLKQIATLLGSEDYIPWEQDDNVFIHHTSIIGESVRIDGPSYIGPHAEIRHGAYLRRGSWICEGSLVGHASEIKNSILLPGSKAPHFNYVGDSILGNETNLGAGTKLSNVRNDRGSVPITNKNGEVFDSGLRKLGAMIGDRSQLGCNVVTNPGAIISPGAMIGPNETVSGWIG
jgi:NDP-sugar pyrophosphorylase family protein